MMKKLFLVFITFMFGMQAQDTDSGLNDIAFQKLLYDIGINLSKQELIVDRLTATDALLNIYQDVEQVTEIVDLLLIIDEEMLEQEVTTIEELIDCKMNSHEDIEKNLIAWLIAYQNMFTVFIGLHDSDDISFDTWCYDIDFIESLQDYPEISDSGYVEFWHAHYLVLEAQRNFELLLKSLE